MDELNQHWVITENGCVIACPNCGHRLELCYPDGTEVRYLPYCPWCGKKLEKQIMKEPSDKQIAFAARISNLTKKPMPTENTAQAYFLYIRDNIQEYQKLRSNYLYDRQRLRERRSKRIYNSVMDDEQDAAWAASMDFSWM